MNSDTLKRQAAEAALDFIEPEMIIGVGTGSTVNFFIDALAGVKGKIDAAVSSSEATTQQLREHGITVLELNATGPLQLYVDGADEFDPQLRLIKGGGGALSREKVLAAASDTFVCIADESKRVETLGQFPLPVEVLPMARSHVGRALLRCGGQPEWRQNFVTDNHNLILDVYHLDLSAPEQCEQALNAIAGVVTVGIFAQRPADIVLLGTQHGVQTLTVQS